MRNRRQPLPGSKIVRRYPEREQAQPLVPRKQRRSYVDGVATVSERSRAATVSVIAMKKFSSLAVLLSAAAPLLAQQPAMAVVEKKAGKVGFYTAAGKRVSEVVVGSFPHETAFSPD